MKTYYVEGQRQPTLDRAIGYAQRLANSRGMSVRVSSRASRSSSLKLIQWVSPKPDSQRVVQGDLLAERVAKLNHFETYVDNGGELPSLVSGGVPW